ncbi:Sensor histidine kinase RcsC [compost metagenome]
MRGMLLKLGFRVRTADGADVALDLLQREVFDAVLVDCQLPRQDGESLCCRIRALPGHAELPLFMIALGGDRERCPTGALIDYLSKPVKFEDLQAALYRRVLCSQQGESADS